MRKAVVGVMCSGDVATDQAVNWATELGKAVALESWNLLSGGRPVGAMAATCRAAKEAGGFVIAISPERHANDVSEYVDIAILTGMGSARNCVNVLSSDVVIAIGGTTAGTISEIGLAVKAKKHVVLLTQDADAAALFARMSPDYIHHVTTSGEAIETAKRLLGP